LQPWFMTTHMSAWLQVFANHIPWWRIGEDYTWLLALDATFALLGVAVLHQRDFKA